MALRSLAVCLLFALLALSSCGGSAVNLDESTRETSSRHRHYRLEGHAGAFPLQGNFPMRVRLFDGGCRSDKRIVKWEWNFGEGWVDATRSRGQLWCTLKKSGACEAQLRITDAAGNQTTCWVKLCCDRKLNAAPVAMPSANPPSGVMPLAVSFNGGDSYDPDGTVTKWEWNFGSGYTDFTRTKGATSKSYSTPGDYTATLRVTDNGRATATLPVTIHVDGHVNQPPLAVANADPQSGFAPLEVSFNAAGSNDPDGSLVKWEWDFGGGFEDFTGSLGDTTFNYVDAGSYDATLRVTDNSGAEATSTVSVTAYDRPVQSGWQHSFGGGLADEAYSTVVDGSGNVYIAGKHVEDAMPGEKRMLILAKYSPDGTRQWAKTFAGSGRDSFVDTTVNGMALDPVNGGVVVLCTSNELSIGGTDFVLAKFGPTGLTFWSRSWGGSGDETGSGVAVDGSGFVYATGTSTSFGGGAEVATARFNPAGDLQWQRLWGGVNSESGVDILVDGNGVSVLANTNELGGGRVDPVLLRYGTNGAFQWAHGYNGDVRARSLDGIGGALLLGGNTCGADASFPGSLMVAQLDGGGSVMWTGAWGNGDMFGQGVAAGNDGVYVSGSAGGNALVARFSYGGAFASAGLWSSGAGSVSGYGLALDASGNVHVAGAAPSAGGSYSDASGGEDPVVLTPFAPAGASRAALGASTWVFGLETPPAGVDDIGGGASDTLILKGFELL